MKTKPIKLRPLDNRVIIRPLPADTVSDGGILIPENARQIPRRGVVYEVGPGKRNRDGVRVPVEVAIGDIVLYDKYAGSEIVLNGEDAWVLREDEIIGVEG